MLSATMAEFAWIARAPSGEVHRGVMVNASCMTAATRNELGHLSLRLRGLSRDVKVSRAFAHLFRPM